MVDNIPEEIALQICADIRRDNGKKWFSFARWQCWGCTKFSKERPEKMCINGKPGFTGCNLVNRRYSKEHGRSPTPGEGNNRKDQGTWHQGKRKG